MLRITRRGFKLLTMRRKQMPANALEFFREAGRAGGKKGGPIGGKKAAENMTAEERKARARKAAAASAKVRKKKAKANQKLK